MRVDSLSLRFFRAHTETSVEFTPKVNLLTGPNGVGKTNVLEALHYLCLSKSFLASRERYVLQKGAPHFEVSGAFYGERRGTMRARIAYVPGEGKRIFVNGAPLERLADIVGQFPVVVFSPQDQAITAEGPGERRRFLNNVLSQGHAVYLENLMAYRRALRQRNELLGQFRRRRVSGSHEAILESWTSEVRERGSRVVARRSQFLKRFATHLQRAYEAVNHVAEKPTIEYDTLAGISIGASLEEVQAAFDEELERTAQRERERGTTLVGPQRDELLFRLDGLEVRRYASQGQHRTFGMALKLAQYFYLREELDESPVLLLDDVFDNLDPQRAHSFLELMQSDTVGQSLITAPFDRPFVSAVAFGQPENQLLYVRKEDDRRCVEKATQFSAP